MKKPKTCGQCRHFKDGMCLVSNVSANEYDSTLQCIFYFVPLKLAKSTFQKMKKKYLKDIKPAQVDINEN